MNCKALGHVSGALEVETGWAADPAGHPVPRSGHHAHCLRFRHTPLSIGCLQRLRAAMVAAVSLSRRDRAGDDTVII